MRWTDIFKKVGNFPGFFSLHLEIDIIQGLFRSRQGLTGKIMNMTILSSPVLHAIYSLCQPLARGLNDSSTALETSATITMALSMKRQFKT